MFYNVTNPGIEVRRGDILVRKSKNYADNIVRFIREHNGPLVNKLQHYFTGR